MIFNTYRSLLAALSPPGFEPSVEQMFESYTSALQSIGLYVTDGVPLGGQLMAVVQNDLRNAMGMADIARRHVLFAIVGYLYNDVPSVCWGSREKHDAWMGLDASERAELVRASEFRRWTPAGPVDSPDAESTPDEPQGQDR